MDRYRREFLSELHHLANRERLFFALSIRFRVAAMNRAVGEIELGSATDDRPKPRLTAEFTCGTAGPWSISLA